MSFDKNYPNRKDQRKPYRSKARRLDPECRPGGSCPACAAAREYKDERKMEANKETS